MGEYSAWFVTKLTELLNDVFAQRTREEIELVYNEVERGIEYARTNPGSIEDILVRMGMGMMAPVKITYKLGSSKDLVQQQKINPAELDELKSALSQRKKDQLVNKMTGSLSALKDLTEEDQEQD